MNNNERVAFKIRVAVIVLLLLISVFTYNIYSEISFVTFVVAIFVTVYTFLTLT